MKTRTENYLDGQTVARLIERAGSLSRTAAAQKADPGYASQLPEEIGFQLTNSCNLSCKHCFQWKEDGFHNSFAKIHQNAELDIELFERVLEETRESRSNLFLWGGEPLIYSQWDRLCGAIARDLRWTVLCTNGIGLQKKIESILPISSHLVSLISLDGFEEENDKLRGRNTFRHVMENIEVLIDLKRKGEYLGEVSVSAVVSTDLIGRLYEFVELFESVGVNTLFLVYPWYVPSVTAEKMDDYYSQHFDWLVRQRLTNSSIEQKNSWHSYDYHLDPDCVDDLKEQLGRIAQHPWKIRVRFRPELNLEEVHGFVSGSEVAGEGRTRCLSIATRMNVMPDGTVTTCKLFPEFAVGNLTDRSVKEVWWSANAHRTRTTLSQGLTPVCSKCIQLYLHGV